MIKITFDQALFILLLICVAVISSFFISGTVKFYNKCDEASEIYNLTFQGTVIVKKESTPLSKSRNIKILSSSNQEKILELLHEHENTLNLKSDRNLFWELIDVGDSIKKESNSFIVKYKKTDMKWQKSVLGFDLCE
jgi:hypothetical protein